MYSGTSKKNNYSSTSFKLLLEHAYKDVHEEWLTPKFKQKFEESLKVVWNSGKQEKNMFCPNIVNILEPFKHVKPDDVKVVILGQDPYPRLRDAIGIAFESGGDVKVSLRRFKKCLDHNNHDSGDGYSLQGWIDQGVLLTNISLTTKEYESGSHIEIWVGVVDILLRLIKKDSVALLLGKTAKSLSDVIPSKHKITHTHPAERSNTFHRKDIFGEINIKLNELSLSSIDWKLV